MRIYEELYILKHDVSEEDADASIEMIKQTVTAAGGSIDKVDKWGVRRLAYKVKKAGEGLFILVQFTAKPETVKEIERRLRVSDNVLKYITVRIDEKLKWLEKRKKIREKRAARKPPPMPMVAPAVPGPGAAPGAPAPAGPTPGAPAPGAPVPAAPAPAAPAPPAPVVAEPVTAEPAAPVAAPETPAVE